MTPSYWTLMLDIAGGNCLFSVFRFVISSRTRSYCGWFVLKVSFQRYGSDRYFTAFPNISVRMFAFTSASGWLAGTGGGTNRCSYFLKFRGGTMVPRSREHNRQ